MNKYIFTILLIACQGFGQKDYKGKLLDAKTNLPIPYVNIGILERGIGTVSNEEGIFHLPLNDEKMFPEDLVIFSSLGYQTIQKTLADVRLQYNEYPVILMEPLAVELEGLVLTNKSKYIITETIGYSNKGEQVYGYWKDNIALGGELGTKINMKKGLSRLDKFTFEVLQNPSDSILLRINMYDEYSGKPGVNLNESGQNILYTLTQNERMVSIDLKPFEVYVENDFYVSLELLKVYGNEELELVLAAVEDFAKANKVLATDGWSSARDNGNGSFRRYSSQGKWEFLSDLNMAFSLETTRWVDPKEYERYQKRTARSEKKQRYITGIAFERGKRIPDVTVFNHTSKESVETDIYGRFKIAADKNDIISCTKKGYKPFRYQIGLEPTMVIRLESL